MAQEYPDKYQEITTRYCSNGYNFVIETTMGKSVYTLDVLQSKNADYDIIARIMATSREKSLFSMFERYIEMKKNIGVGRWTSIEAHDIRYNNLENVITSLEERNVHVEVYERSLKIEDPQILYKTGDTGCRCVSVKDALEFGVVKSINL